MDTKTVTTSTNEVVVVPAKKWYESKQIRVAIVTSVVGILTALTTEYPTVGIFVALKGVLDFFLRYSSYTAIE